MYYDEENRRHILNMRSIFAEAAGNLADKGRMEDAQRLIDRVEKGISPDNLPYALASRYNSHNQTGLLYLEACYKAGKKDLAEKIRLSIRKDLEDQKKYYEYIKATRPSLYNGFERTEAPINEIMLEVLSAIESKYAPQVKPNPTIETPGTIPNGPVRPDSGNTKDTNH